MALAFLSLSKDGEQTDYRFQSDIYFHKKHGSDNYWIKIDLDGSHVGSLELVFGDIELEEIKASINKLGGDDGQN